MPWAFRVTRELGEIRAALDGRGWQESAIDNLRGDVGEIKERLARMGNGRN